MNRRGYLALLGGTGIAGCSFDFDEEDDQTPSGTVIEEWPSPTPTPDGTARQRLGAAATRASGPSRTPGSSSSPTVTTVPEPSERSLARSGDRIIGPFPIQGGFTVFYFHHFNGKGTFSVRLIEDDTGETREVLASGHDEWNGEIATFVPAGEYRLRIEAIGAWNVLLTQPRPIRADLVDLPITETDDAGAVYFGPIAFPGNVSVSATHDGSANFRIAALNIRGKRIELLFDETGPVDSERTFPADGYGWMTVTATGEWTISIEEA